MLFMLRNRLIENRHQYEIWTWVLILMVQSNEATICKTYASGSILQAYFVPCGFLNSNGAYNN